MLSQRAELYILHLEMFGTLRRGAVTFLLLAVIVHGIVVDAHLLEAVAPPEDEEGDDDHNYPDDRSTHQLPIVNDDPTDAERIVVKLDGALKKISKLSQTKLMGPH